jgi:hypothetical protein
MLLLLKQASESIKQCRYKLWLMLLGILTPIITSVKSFQQAEVPTIHQREFPSKENAIIVTAAVSCTEHSMDFSVTGPILPITRKN